MSWKFWKKAKPRVYLGTLRVDPRDDFKRHLEIWSVDARNRVALEIYGYLEEFFQLPPASEVADPARSDLGLDVTVLQWQLGQAMEFNLGFGGIPLVWRPKIVLQARLFYLQSGKTRSVYKATEKMSWGVFFDRVISWRNFFFRNVLPLRENDMKNLLYQASIKVLKKAQQAI